MSWIRDGMILGGPVWEFLLALASLAVGTALLFCGANVCWSRAARRTRADLSGGFR